MKAALALGFVAVLASFAPAQGRWNQRERAINRTERGSGTVHFKGRDYSVSQVQVTLASNGRATIRAVRSGSDVVFTGKWGRYGLRNDAAGVVLDRVSYDGDSDRASVRGRVDLRGNSFDTVDLMGQNSEERNDLWLRFDANGRSWDDRDDRWDNNNGRWDRDDYRNNRGDAVGRYTDSERWSRRNDDFFVKYVLELSSNGRARLVVSSEDRNMPNDETSRRQHGDVIRYLHSGQDVVQTGRWSQSGDRVTINWDRISYGGTTRTKSSTWRGRQQVRDLRFDSYDESFYGRRSELTFERS